MGKFTSLVGIIGVLSLLAGGVLYWVHKQMVLSSKITLLLGFGLLLISFIAYLIQQREFFTKRATKYGLNAGVVIILFLGILILLNFLGARHKASWDLTANKFFSLSDQSLKVLKLLERDVKIYNFDRKGGAENPRMEYLLGLYEYHSPKVKVTTVDPEREPQVAKKFGVRKFGTIVVVSGARHEKIEENPTEEKITNAIVRATKGEQKKIYFLTGHGEKQLNSMEKDGYKAVNDALVDANFQPDTLFLLMTGKIPEDASLLVIAGPEYDYTEPELKQIEEYLAGGGKLLLMLEPGKYPELCKWIEQFGVRSEDNSVVDVSGMGFLFGANELMPVVGTYDKFNPITKEFTAATMFAMVRGLERAEESGGYSIVELAKTSPQSWAERDYQAKKMRFDDERDGKGPVTIAMALSKPAVEGKETRIVIFGDSDFVSNSYYRFSGNRDLFLNSINWLTLEEELISIRPKEEADRRVNLSAATQRMLFYLIVIVLPFISLLVGAIVWWRRRG